MVLYSVVLKMIGIVRKNENLVVMWWLSLNNILLMIVEFECDMLGISVKYCVILILNVLSGVSVLIDSMCGGLLCLCCCVLVYRMIVLFMMSVNVMGIGENSMVLIFFLNRRLSVIVGIVVIMMFSVKCCVFGWFGSFDMMDMICCWYF